MATIVKPPQLLSFPPTSTVLFLAGSIEMGAAENWQLRLERELNELDVFICNPRRDDWDASWEQRMSNPKFLEQVTWEMNHLDASDVIPMYFDPNTKSPISLLELGLHARSGKMIICCPDGFWRKGNVEIVCRKYGIPLFNDIDAFIIAVKARVKSIQSVLQSFTKES